MLPTRPSGFDASGVITLRHAGKLRHLDIGRAHKHRPVIVPTNGPRTMTIDRTTSEILAEHTINPDRAARRASLDANALIRRHDVDVRSRLTA